MPNTLENTAPAQPTDISAKDVLKNIGNELEELKGNSLRIQTTLGDLIANTPDIAPDRLEDFQALDKITQCLENLAIMMRHLSDESEGNWNYCRSNISMLLTLKELQEKILDGENLHTNVDEDCDFF